ncbi:acyl-CoA 6-desaturase-like [Watersipora subatra]|uniref:acyl-CoA 6-desaturase-like n=1 Tax=Watersipora subatra TaxID=2589382 RepID=UPI00355B2516
MATANRMKKGTDSLPSYSWEEINKHSEKSSRWIVIDREVYDVTNWSKKHPGGSSVLGHSAGQDATEVFQAMHRNNLSYVNKFLRPLKIGRLEDSEVVPHMDIRQDFAKLEKTAAKMGLFDASFTFFAIVFLHIVVFDIASYLVLRYYGSGWIPWMISITLFTTAQVQMGWHHHDAGHLSIFKNNTLNRFYHKLLICLMKGTCSHWWNHLHYQHHAKPNVIGKDPDVRVEALFVVGNVMPVETAKSQEKVTMPYNWQHRYFLIIGPPLLFPVYFQFMNFRHAYTRKLWLELAVMVSFYVRIYLMYAPLLGGLWGFLLYYEINRVLESTWFTWVSQTNHIPMTVEKDESHSANTWLTAQLKATCNVEKSFFNDWFTGHLNFQIEHHLFPQMPRHNLYKIAPLVKSLCEKHDVTYKVKSLKAGFLDVISSLKKSGELWLHTYNEFHPM